MKPVRLLLIVGAGFVALLGVLGVLLWLALPTLIQAEVKKRAREQGVELTLGTLDFGWEWAELRATKATLIGVSGLELGIDRLNVELDGTELTRLDFTGLTVEASGSVPALALSLGAWSKKYPHAFALPVAAREVTVRFRPEPGQAVWLELTGGTVATTAANTIVVAEHAKVAGIDVGRVGATWTATATSVALGLGETELAKAPVRVAVDLAAPRPRLAFQLVPTALERLAGPFAVVLPIHGVSASATIALEFADKAASFPDKGAAHLELHGWIPPHPAELDGFVFGDTTIVDTTLAFSPDGKSVTLDPTHLVAGRFELGGKGSLVRDSEAATLTLDLTGALPCDALASAAAESRVGRLLGHPQGSRAGSVARQVIGGAVGVRVQVNASTKNLAGASVKRSIGIGCGLKPLSLDDVLRLGETLLPSDLSELQQDIVKLTPKLPNGAPLIPSILPPLPLPPLPTNFGDLGLPVPLPGPAPASTSTGKKPAATKPAASATRGVTDSN